MVCIRIGTVWTHVLPYSVELLGPVGIPLSRLSTTTCILEHDVDVQCAVTEGHEKRTCKTEPLYLW
jgi:hypothetical protein